MSDHRAVSTRIVWVMLTLGCSGQLAMEPPSDAGARVDARARDASLDAGRDGGTSMTERDADTPDAGPPDAGWIGDAGPPSARHTMRPLGTTAAAQGYWEYLPPGYPERGPAPLLLFFHGIGENGNGTSDLARVADNGIPRLIERDGWDATRPFVVLSPQHPGGGCHTPAEIRSFIEFAISEYSLDESRLYATGLSCGGIGLFNYLGEDVDARLAAAVPIAGDGRNAWRRQGCALGRLPLWAFHGDADTIVPPIGTTEPMSQLMACTDPAPVDARMTIYPEVGHDSWSATYDGSAGHDIYAWLLGHRRP
jgi:predicted peptidase